MIQEYRCQRCNHLLFKGSLKLLVTRQHDPDKGYIEPKCDKCGLLNRFSFDKTQELRK
jgi:phage FluMu protein Com